MEDGGDSAPFIPTEDDMLSNSTLVDGLPPTQHSDSPIRKRAQCQDSCSSPCAIGASQPSSGVSQELDVPHRDPQFYMADGSCVLRIGNTLFNVRFSYLLVLDR